MPSQMSGLGSSNEKRPGSKTIDLHKKAVRRVVTALRAQSDQKMSLRDLAEIAVMSPTHLDRVFRTVVGVSPRRYLSALRLTAAKQLLLETSLSVLDVCIEVGYSSLGSFSTRFTRTVGLSPSEFRRLGDQEQDCRRLREQILRHLTQPEQEAAVAETMVPGIYGTVSAPRPIRDPIFVGLFDDPIPEGPPFACTVLDRPGPFQVHPLVVGSTVCPFAIALDWSGGWQSLLLHESVLQAAPEADGGWTIPARGLAGPVALELDSPNPLQPPILIAIPALIASWIPS